MCHFLDNHRRSFQPASRHLLTSLFTSCERARVVTSSVSGMSTITRSSTPRQATSRPEPGTTIPPATCSVSTTGVLSANLSHGFFYNKKRNTCRDCCFRGRVVDWIQQVIDPQEKRSHRRHPNLQREISDHSRGCC
jgi:hypothetical protein